MAGKVLEYDLIYRVNGEEKKDKIKISFVSNWCIREFNEISQIVLDVRNKWDEYSDIISEISAVAAGAEGNADLLDATRDAIIEEIASIAGDDVLRRRFELIKTLLVDNSYKKEKYFDFDFWDRQVEPAVQLDFLEKCVFKDIDKKKAQ